MATTVSWYGLGLQALQNQGIVLANLKFGLVMSGYAPNRITDQYWSTPQANEEAGAGYAAGSVGSLSAALALISGTASGSLAPAWEGSTAYVLGQVVRPAAGQNGHVYVCVVAGTSGAGAPTWPTTRGTTVTDGGVTWAEAGTGYVKLSISAPTWAALTDATGPRYGVLYYNTGTALLRFWRCGISAPTNPARADSSWSTSTRRMGRWSRRSCRCSASAAPLSPVSASPLASGDLSDQRPELPPRAEGLSLPSTRPPASANVCARPHGADGRLFNSQVRRGARSKSVGAPPGARGCA